MRLTAFILLSFIFAFAFPCASFSQDAGSGASTAACNPVVRVLLDRDYGNAPRLFVSAEGPFTVKDELGNLIASGGSGTTICIAPQSGKDADGGQSLSVSDVTYGGEGSTDDSDMAPRLVTVCAVDNDQCVTLGTPGSAKRNAYRGSVNVSVSPAGGLRVVNAVALEDYLVGVIRPEIGARAPLEAMKAQAVAARTYAIKNLGRLRLEGADLDDTKRCQNYAGKAGECPGAITAAAETRGQVLIYDGAVIDAMYCTECGGTTAQGPPDEPYLRPVTTAACRRKGAWSYSISSATLAAAFRRCGDAEIGRIRLVKVLATEASGRATEVELDGETRRTTLSGIEIRQLLGPDNVRSTLFTVKETADGAWTFSGEGWGHGLGMCQAGAVARASGPNPENYAQILADYYPGTQLTTLTVSLVRPPLTPHATTVSRR